jgi:hypothetical protein
MSVRSNAANGRRLAAAAFSPWRICAKIRLQLEVEMAKIKYFTLLLLMVAALPFAAAAKTAPVESRWQKTPLKIDGDIGDWLAPSFNSEKSVQVDYAFGNDGENLYLIFIFKDQKYLSSLAQTGFTIWFNDQGKKKKISGLRFEKKTLSAAELIAVMEKKSGPLAEEKKKEMLAKPSYVINQFMAVNGDNEDQTEVVFKQQPLPEFTTQFSSGRLAFEFRIPIGPGNGLNLAPGKKVMVGFDWGGSTKEMRRALLQRGGYEGGDAGGLPEEPNLDPDEVGQRESGGLPSMRGPKHYVFWSELTLAAGAN